MSHISDRQDAALDLLGRHVAARLEQGSQDLPYGISERLRAARVRAVAARKREVVVGARLSVQPRWAAAGGAPAPGDSEVGLWRRLASALPVVLLVAGLVLIQTNEDDRRAYEVAEVDAALLIDDLPPAAYADPGFVQFLKADH